MAVQIRNILVGAGYMYTSDPRTRAQDSPFDPANGGTFDGSYSAASLFESEGSPRDTMEDLAADTESDWRAVGATQDGLEIAYNPDTGEVEIDQQKDAALVFNTGVNVTMSTNLAEASLANLALSWGQDETSISEDGDDLHFAFGTPGDFYTERSVIVVGNAPPTETGDERDRVYHARRVISAEGSTHTLNRTDNVAFDVTFRMLPDPAFRRVEIEADEFEDSSYGEILDRVPTPAE